MPLIDLKTSLKSLKFGKDRPYGGSSNQPYIQSSIPEGDIPTSGGPDFILRGGILAPISAAKDVSRLTQMFFDLKSPNGFQFIAKQNILSRTSVQTQASSNGGAAYAAGAVNQGVYLPSSTLAQAGVGFTGTHLNLLGIDPSSPMTGITNKGISDLFSTSLTLGLKRYEDVVRENPNEFNPSNNRLYELSTKNGLILSQTPQSQDDKKDPKNFFQKVGNFLQNFSINSPGNGVLMKYSGGPGSILGVGQTIIPFADQRTGTNNIELQNLGFFGDGNRTIYSAFDHKKSNKIDFPKVSPSDSDPYIDGINTLYRIRTGTNIDNTEGYTIGSEDFSVYQLTTTPGIFKPFRTFKPSTLQNSNGSLTFTQDQLIKQNQKGPIQDFRKVLIDGSKNGNNSGEAAEDVKNKNSSIISLSPDYRRNNIENRLNLGSPGSPKNVFDYVAASGNGVPEDYKIALDKITAGDIYSDTVARHNKYKSGDKHAGNDLVKFSIGVIQNNTTGLSNFMHFRAFIDSFNDSYNADWGSYNYVGRGDKFYNYEGFERTINLSFTVFAQSKAELIPMYKKLNYLASSLAPDYSEKSGFMKGNLHKMTIGGYLFDQVGIIKSITYDVPEETPWEIGINNEQEVGDDTSVKELPHMIKVTGLTFVPIQHFLPRVANPSNQSKTRYIALAASTDDNDTNYTRKKTYDFQPPPPPDADGIDEITLQ
jgi:hypothetical protein